MPKVLLSLGSNVGDSMDTLQSALADIKSLSTDGSIKISSFYRTKPVGYLQQDDFINVASSLPTALKPLELLAKLQELELKYKRVRLFKNGPRTLDIDIIAYGDETVNMPSLEIPHPRMQERAFVLRPLLDIEPDFKVPPSGVSISELYKALSEQEKQDVKVINA